MRGVALAHGEDPNRRSDRPRSASATEALQMLFHPAALRLSRQILMYTARIIRRHKQIGSL